MATILKQVKMINIKLSLIMGLMALSIGDVYSIETINCSVENTTFSRCIASEQAPDALGHNVKIVREIDLNPIMKSFRKFISKQLSRKSCEKKVFIKSATLKLKDELLIIDIRARLNRQYCTRRAKAQVYEKTNNLRYSLLPVVSETSVNFTVQDSKQKPTVKQASFEKSFTDVVGMNIKKKINLALNEILALDVENINLSIEPNSSIVFKSAVINSKNNVLRVVLSTSINKSK